MNLAEIKPSKTQQKAWDKLLDSTTLYILYGGSAFCGKTFLGCQWLFVMAMSYPGTKWFMARNELKELRDSTLLTFYKVLRHHQVEPDTVMKYNGQDHFIHFHNGSRVDLLDIKYLPSDPYYERLGSLEFTGGFIDEAGPTEFMAFDILKSRVGRYENQKYGLTAKILLCSNPSKGWLYQTFYLPSKDGTLPKNMAFIKALPTDNTFLDKSYLDNLQNISSRVNKERLLYGIWEYADSEGGLIEYDAIIDAFGGAVSAKVRPGKYYITCDVARFGSDSTVIILWSGLRAEKILQFEELAVTQTAQKIRALMAQFRVPVSNIVVDQDGIGGGLCDFLPGCVNFANNSKPKTTNKGKENFTNLKTQAYFMLSKMINDREIYINCENQTIKEKLIQELEYVRLKNQDTEGKLAIVSKKEVKEAIGRSPDFSDCLMFRMYFELEPKRWYIKVYD
jgi:phage terminase large subunit